MKKLILSCALLCAASVWAAPEWVRGEITKLSPEKAQLTVRHEAIRSLGMDAMTMPYTVRDAAVLKGFKVGDAVRFTVSMQGEQMRMDALEHAR